MQKSGKTTDRAHKRHVRLFSFLRIVLGPFIKAKYNYSFESLKDIDGPYLLLCNHNTEYDPIFLGMAAHNQLYFVSSEHVSRNKFLFALLDFVFNPILHYKGKAGVNTISSMLRTLKAGHSVAIFPEGNRSFNGKTLEFLPTIGKLARKSGAKLITYKIEGGYFTQPRWGFTDRKGQLTGKLVHIYELDELKNMTDDEVNDAIVRDIDEDAYATQAKVRVPFKGKRLAYGLESTLFFCPKCKKGGRMHSTDTHLNCECGYKSEYNVYGDLVEENGCSMTVTEIDELQQKELARLVEENKDNTSRELFSDEVILMQIDKAHNISEQKHTTLSAFSDHVTINGSIIRPSDLQGLAIRSRNTLVTHTIDNVQYELTGTSKVFNALKYLYLYNLIHN